MADTSETAALPSPAAPSAPPERKWPALPIVAAVVFVVAAVGAAYTETPTIDEYAFVPAGLAHWRHGDWELFRNNPPPGKMWLALPLVLDSSVVSPDYEGNGTGWEGWRYGQEFERANSDRYLSLMARARLMVIPLVLVSAVMIFFWCRQLFGQFAAAISTTLFLLSPTILANGHLATIDVAAMTTICAAVFALRWSLLAPRWPRVALAGAALGLALATKFTAFFLLVTAPVLVVLWLVRPSDQGLGLQPAVKYLAVYALACWLTLNALLGFAGTFEPLGSIPPRSEFMRNVVEMLPDGFPRLLPRVYVTGLYALEDEVNGGVYDTYFNGQWYDEPLRSYYFVAFAIKETEVVVLLTVVALALLCFTGPAWRERATIVLPPAVLLAIVAFLSPLCLGIRYILPAFPFVFVALGVVFQQAEASARRTSNVAAEGQPKRLDRRWLVALPLAVYALAVTAFTYPAYLSYFNTFVGGPSRGEHWLLRDWGQDLYLLPKATERLHVDRWKLLYFGNVDPAAYGIEYDLPIARPEPAMYAVSTSYWKGISYATLTPDGTPVFAQDRVAWLAVLPPTERVGTFEIFDLLHEPPAGDTAVAKYHTGLYYFARKDYTRAAQEFSAAVALDTKLGEAYYFLAQAQTELGDRAATMQSLRAGLRSGRYLPALADALALQIMAQQNPTADQIAEAVTLAQGACEQSKLQNLHYLGTLAHALVAAGRNSEAVIVARQTFTRAVNAQEPELADALRTLLEGFAPRYNIRRRDQ